MALNKVLNWKHILRLI